jgi:hypothetical protein
LVVFQGPPPPDHPPAVPGEGGGGNTAGQQAGVAIQRLPPPTAVAITPAQSFSDLVAQQLGTFGTGGDGFDTLFNVPASRFGSDVPALSIFDATLAAADALGTTFDPSGFDDIASLLSGFLSVGDAFFGVSAGAPVASSAQTAVARAEEVSTAAQAVATADPAPDVQPAPRGA